MNNSLHHLIRDTRWRRLPLLMLLVAMFGCIPISLTYWEPAVPGGKPLNSAPGTVGYKDMLELSINDVGIQFVGGGSWIVVKVLIPEGRSVSFVSDELELREDKAYSKMLKFKMSDWDPKTLKKFHISPRDVMHGKNTSVLLLGGLRPMVYAGSIKFGGGDRLHYAVTLPSLKVGDQVFNIPVVEFTRKEGFGIGSVN